MSFVTDAKDFCQIEILLRKQAKNYLYKICDVRHIHHVILHFCCSQRSQCEASANGSRANKVVSGATFQESVWTIQEELSYLQILIYALTRYLKKLIKLSMHLCDVPGFCFAITPFVFKSL